ncbi:uridine kinase/uracil phosphoribosyltransferase [Schizosaccharomyces japonicus yFS275]|uniref:Uridine kinase n=1 Tax=Schizosaccharomyces japonicus (strain yFS275 / FY16936) TaxID=402676 RepID=B6K4Z3_SCHJY|nr:uridine kinase/uracil phosphoribosyltransferase [Schizosaccharomyces japonicus yFS275]EEB08550.2 uridine kinase/uracil phosphoribosyltransferase [Schizosaccharomyces japonicus yFS275]
MSSMTSLSSMSTNAVTYQPPWRRIRFVGIAGPSGSGKTSVAQSIVKSLNQPNVVILSLDSFYKPLTPEQRQQALQNNYDFDKPESIDWDLLYEKLVEIKAGRKVEIPVYSFIEHNRLNETITVYGASIIIVEGIFALFNENIRSLFDVSIFLDTDPDVCLSRRLSRDITYRGRDILGVLQQYSRFVKPSYDTYVRTQAKYTDIIVPRGRDNKTALNMVYNYIIRTLSHQSSGHMRNLSTLQAMAPTINDITLNIIELRKTPELEAIKTILLDKSTDSDSVQFYLSRIGSMLMSLMSDCLAFEETEVTLHSGSKWTGLKLAKQICGVSILRSGGTLEAALLRQYTDVRMGKILVQIHGETGEPSLKFYKFPHGIAAMDVVLMAAALRDEANVLMALQVLVDFGVPQESIILVVYVSLVESIKTLSLVFPKITIVTAFVEPSAERCFSMLDIEGVYFGC